MFNVQGSEIIIILLVALIVLGPEKLPDAIRKFSKFYAEARKMSTGFQSELRNALDEPMRELRDTAELVRKNADFRDLVATATGDAGGDDRRRRVPRRPVGAGQGLAARQDEPSDGHRARSSVASPPPSSAVTEVGRRHRPAGDVAARPAADRRA